MFNVQVWQEAYNKAKEEVKDLPVKLATDRKGFRGERPVVYLVVPVKGNKKLIESLNDKGWCSLRAQNIQGCRILELERVY